MSPHLPLDGVTVLALEQAVAGPLATRHLADHGARVLKVERPGVGDFAREYDHSVGGESSYFVWLNRGKESLALDLRAAEDLRLLESVAADCDVLLQNLRPGAVERLGLGADRLRELNPRLVHVSISGYGPDGPYAGRKAYDLLIQCETGVLDVTGTAQDPCKVGFSVADIATGMYAYSAVLTALYDRERTGRGCAVHVPMIGAMAEWMSQPAYRSAAEGRPFTRTGASHASISPYGPYRCADGVVFLGIQSDREWRVFAQDVLGRPELGGDERFATNVARVRHDALIRVVVEERFASLSRLEATRLLERLGIANAVARPAAELVEHPQLVARHRLVPVETPSGPMTAVMPPVESADWTVTMGAVPRLGEHTEAVRAAHARSGARS
ncbi:CoA transferase [Phycicoccus endophyticus]|uniref:CoA transferase n=1 Tax=Phycicoccus endophyticus TaxID=1690220 RepID=A0A7G9QZD4_9MICO|nr:CaiB/BaiF CoA-transferase family protein [Phycicoccus endophyticus]NHI19065.1 CoA transferase [Phycicoccus endophyticus]QNN48709.1 CoA transferase [Phycicoccus endophyticus]GGL32561.1 dehydratase [Phycicoccus endophyticus]